MITNKLCSFELVGLKYKIYGCPVNWDNGFVELHNAMIDGVNEEGYPLVEKIPSTTYININNIVYYHEKKPK